jgi:hypothetical protein
VSFHGGGVSWNKPNCLITRSGRWYSTA